MRVHSFCQEVLLGFLVVLLFSGSLCHGSDKTVEVVGIGECTDCQESNIKTSHALSGLRVSVDCKSKNGEFKTRGVGELDKDGKFTVSLPQEILEDGELKEECYTQLHSASAAPCAVHNGLEAMKITFQSKNDQKHTFRPAGKLKFSSAVCTSAFLWPYFKYRPLPKLPPLTKGHPWFKHFGHPYLLFPPHAPKVFPPIALPPPVPIYKPIPKPPVFKPHPVPTYKPIPKPPVPIYKPIPKPPVFIKPPPVPIYKPKPKPKTPVFKPPPIPIYKPKPKPKAPVFKPPPVPKPPVFIKPPPVPIYKPKPKAPVFKPPPIPIYKPKPKIPIVPYKPFPPPIPKVFPPKPKVFPPLIPKVFPPPITFYKPPPPIPKIPKFPPFYKKPCPPLPKLPPLPKIPPKYFHHPIVGFPPHPPHFPHP